MTKINRSAKTGKFVTARVREEAPEYDRQRTAIHKKDQAIH
jgi:hypothetical protein